jgi:hypothetical protein
LAVLHPAAGSELSKSLEGSGFAPKQIQGALTVATQLASGNVIKALVTALEENLSLSGHPDADVATKAARTGIALSKANLNSPASLSAVLGGTVWAWQSH